MPIPFRGWAIDGAEMRLTPLLLVLACVLVTGCAGHSAVCSSGVARSDCPPGTEGYERMKQAQQDAKAIVEIDDARCRSQGAEPGSEAYATCRRRAAAAHQLLEPAH
jgi:hypothetical protein